MLSDTVGISLAIVGVSPATVGVPSATVGVPLNTVRVPSDTVGVPLATVGIPPAATVGNTLSTILSLNLMLLYTDIHLPYSFSISLPNFAVPDIFCKTPPSACRFL